MQESTYKFSRKKSKISRKTKASLYESSSKENLGGHEQGQKWIIWKIYKLL